MDDKYAKFKQLLEYFVSHLHWYVNEDESYVGYKKYIEPISDFKKTGKGYDGDNIQKQISEWEEYGNFKITIRVQPQVKISNKHFLVWPGTWVNVRPKWQGKEIGSLYLTREEKGDAKEELCYSLVDLGLFDEQDPNDNLKNFFDQYYGMMLEAKEMIDQYIELLKSNKNLILTGAPGTGKTYLAKQMAKQTIETDELENNEQYGFVQFHPSYDYTDFVEGLRPTKPDANGNIGFELREGVFKEFCGKALANGDKKYVFVIDEINRGDISKIFGELFFSIDPGYRGKKGAVKTQYANMHKDEEFYVPENVYIIGTMNDIDRSVESFDFAMRRRFVWQEVTAEESAENMGLSEGTKAVMKRLNDEIANTEGLNSSYQIGGAYFLDSDGKERNDYDDIWELRLKPLLSEYLRGMPDEKNTLEKLKNAYDGGSGTTPNNG